MNRQDRLLAFFFGIHDFLLILHTHTRTPISLCSTIHEVYSKKQYRQSCFSTHWKSISGGKKKTNQQPREQRIPKSKISPYISLHKIMFLHHKVLLTYLETLILLCDISLRNVTLARQVHTWIKWPLLDDLWVTLIPYLVEKKAPDGDFEGVLEIRESCLFIWQEHN